MMETRIHHHPWGTDARASDVFHALRRAAYRASLVGTVLTAILTCATAYDVAAQSGPTFDHLNCYRISANGQVDGHALDPLTLTPFLTPPFEAEQGCRLQPAKKPRPTHVCVPVDKQPRDRPVGTSIGHTYLVYRLRCPSQPDTSNGFVDQFFRGTADIKREPTTRLLLVPAYPSTTPTSPCQSTAPDQCGGDCPNWDERCELVPDGSCGCVQQPPCGGVPEEGVCGGVCDDGAHCLPHYDGTCACLR